jgi:hypothetical protein
MSFSGFAELQDISGLAIRLAKFENKRFVDSTKFGFKKVSNAHLWF